MLMTWAHWARTSNGDKPEKSTRLDCGAGRPSHTWFCFTSWSITMAVGLTVRAGIE